LAEASIVITKTEKNLLLKDIIAQSYHVILGFPQLS